MAQNYLDSHIFVHASGNEVQIIIKNYKTVNPRGVQYLVIHYVLQK